jgi:hypothetical protein
MAKLNRNNPFELLVDDHHGQYVAQVFAETIKRELFPDVSAEDWAILESGPDHEHYHDVAADIDSWQTADGISIMWQDGALWAVDWSHIGNADDQDDYGAMAKARLQADESAWQLYCDLRANLYDGPGNGRWSENLLSALRDTVQDIAQQIESELPLYWSTDYGIEELRIDVESLMLEEMPGLKELSTYW